MEQIRKKHFALGAIAGFSKGKDRAGLYVIGEEAELAAEFGDPVNFNVEIAGTRAAGFLFGYKIGAEGGSLPSKLIQKLD